MKKIISVIFAFAICTMCSLTAFADGFQQVERVLPLVVDNADLLDDDEEQSLIEKLQSVGDMHECEAAVVTVTSLEGKSDRDFADDFYDYNGYGYGANDDGLLFLLDMGSRTMYITTHGTAISAVTDYGREQLFDDIEYDIKRGDYYDAFIEYAETVDYYYDCYESGEPYDVERGDTLVTSLVTIAIVVGGALLVACIGTSIMKDQLKSAVSKPAATDYVRAGSLNITQSDDIFLYRNVTKVRESSSSSGGRSGGSSSHRSSSGRSHGGGGRRF